MSAAVDRECRSCWRTSGYVSPDNCKSARWPDRARASLVPSSPHVMLSPNARKDVTLSFGGGSTTTANVQLAVRARASDVVHVTVLVPIGNDDPLTGTQLVLSGAWPPLTTGAGNETASAAPSSELTGSGAAGHVMVGASGTGVGAPRLTLHAAIPTRAITTHHRVAAMRNTQCRTRSPIRCAEGVKVVRKREPRKGYRFVFTRAAEARVSRALLIVSKKLSAMR